MSAKVLPFRPRRTSSGSDTAEPTAGIASDASAPTETPSEFVVPDPSRRGLERKILSEFVVAQAVHRGISVALRITDLTTQGAGLWVEKGEPGFVEGDSIVLRLYVGSIAYFPMEARVVRVEDKGREGVQYGTQFIAESLHQSALEHLVRFLQEVVLCVRTDSGSLITTKIRS